MPRTSPELLFGKSSEGHPNRCQRHIRRWLPIYLQQTYQLQRAQPLLACRSTAKTLCLRLRWTQFKFKWTDFVMDPTTVPQGPVEFKQLGRIDLLQVVPDGTTVDFLITGVKLATAAELL